MNKRTRKIVFNVIVITLLVIGFVWVCSRFVHLGRVEYTDNAQVRQHIVPVNSRLQGFIKKIYFEEYAPVHKGDTLLLIEDAEFRLREAQAEAVLYGRYRDTGKARVFTLTDAALKEFLGAEAAGRDPSHLPFITAKGEVIHAPLIKTH